MKFTHILVAVLLIVTLLACPLAMAEEAAQADEGFYITEITDDLFERIQGKAKRFPGGIHEIGFLSVCQTSPG